VKQALGLILLLSCCLAFAQVSEDALLGVHELNPQDISDQHTDDNYKEYEPFSGALSVSGYSGSTDYLVGYLHFKQESWLVRGGMRLEDQRSGNLQLKFKDALALGAYRPAWAQGLVFSAANQSPRLLNPPHPQSHAPLGLALNLQYKAWAVLAAVSAVERDVRLAGESISYLPRTKGLYLASTDERLGAFGVVYARDRFDVGALYYHQSYNRGFANTELDSVLNMGSTFIRLKGGSNTVQAELALQGGPAALKTMWESHSGNLHTRVGYARIGKYQRPAYAAKPLLLSSLDEREEIRAELKYKLRRSLSIAGGTVLNHRRGSLDDPAWLAHSSVRIAYRDRESRFSLALKLIDREILSEVDSSYVNSKPLHIRLQLSAAQRVHDHWSVELNARYHHQEKTAAINNGSYWAQHLVYHQSRLKFKTGFSVLSSANYKMLVIADNDLGYELWGKSNVQAELECAFRLKWWHITGKAQQELQDSRRTKLSLRLSSRFG
jgi:hypothetical protein